MVLRRVTVLSQADDQGRVGGRSGSRYGLRQNETSNVEVVVRVLVVSEDVKERLRAVSALLLHAGAEVVEATSAEEARERVIVDKEPYDVFVVDGDLVPRGGFAVLYDLRARAELDGEPGVPSLIMTSREQDRWLAKWAGASEVLVKPVDPFELARRVAALEGTDPAPYGDSDADADQLAAAIRDHLEQAP